MLILLPSTQNMRHRDGATKQNGQENIQSNLSAWLQRTGPKKDLTNTGPVSTPSRHSTAQHKRRVRLENNEKTTTLIQLLCIQSMTLDSGLRYGPRKCWPLKNKSPKSKTVPAVTLWPLWISTKTSSSSSKIEPSDLSLTQTDQGEFPSFSPSFIQPIYKKKEKQIKT